MFHKVPGIVSETGFTFEISDDWTIFSIAKNGKQKFRKPNKKGQVRLAGKWYTVHAVAKLAGLPRKEWSETELEWDELDDTSDGHGFRYRAFENAVVQRMNQHGEETFQTWTWRATDGYFRVCIAGKTMGVHQMMGLTRFVPKPPDMPASWTVHHKNNDPSNNHYTNLEWASPETQNKERRPMEQPRIDSYPVIGTALRDLVLKDKTKVAKGEEVTFDTAGIAAVAIVGGTKGHISHCINGNLKSHAGFVWKTPPSDPDFDNEEFKSDGENDRSERFVSTFGRLKQQFHHGYSKILLAKDLLTDRAHRERDYYPHVMIGSKDVKFHRKVVESFFGEIKETIPIGGKSHRLIVDHIDDVKTNARLGNLQLLTQQENSLKRNLKTYETSVASFYDGKHEYHATREAAIEHVKAHGYPEATLEELNANVLLTAHMNVPARLYGRMWIRAHFTKYTKK
ncbi:hypothetical protein PBCVNEJV1_369L [Paramecium bursaria Chlorella virus NE-JV-1]|nr:hypothetical protein PBCVNEJV1_369L [Paramecium bursaria Chlorella virus NE-JV-1]